MLPAVLEFHSVNELQDTWLGAPALPFRPIAITGDVPRLIVRVTPQELDVAEAFFASHPVTVDNHPLDIRLVAQTQPEPDESVTHLRDRFVGTPVDEARDALTTLGWTVRIGAPRSVSTADHRPRRLNLIVSDQGVVIDLFTG